MGESGFQRKQLHAPLPAKRAYPTPTHAHSCRRGAVHAARAVSCWAAPGGRSCPPRKRGSGRKADCWTATAPARTQMRWSIDLGGAAQLGYMFTPPQGVASEGIRQPKKKASQQQQHVGTLRLCSAAQSGGSPPDSWLLERSITRSDSSRARSGLRVPVSPALSSSLRGKRKEGC